jgi:hypothetical protein
MTVLAGRVHTLPRVEITDLDAIAAIRQQKASAASLATIIETAIAAVKALPEPPLGWHTGGYDQASVIETLRDMLPTQTQAEMEMEVDIQTLERQLEARQTANEARRGLG